MLYSAGRDSLYTVDELMAGYRSDAPMQSLDARIAAHVAAAGIPPADVVEAIAQVVHDQGVDQAMRAYVAASVAKGRHIAGVMGGSSTPRDAPAYRLAAETAKALSEAGFLVATGGGLGIMEAGNLGAYFAGHPREELDAAIDELERWPDLRRTRSPVHRQRTRDHGPPPSRLTKPCRRHLAVRRRADQPVRHAHRQALPELGPRGRATQHRRRRRDVLRGRVRNASGDLPRPRPKRLRRPARSDAHGVRGHRRIRRARIPLPPRSCSCRPGQAAIRRSDHACRLGRLGRGGHHRRPRPWAPAGRLGTPGLRLGQKRWRASRSPPRAEPSPATAARAGTISLVTSPA